MSFICSNPGCLKKFIKPGDFQKHLNYAKKGCTKDHLKSYKSYLAGLTEPGISGGSKSSTYATQKPMAGPPANPNQAAFEPTLNQLPNSPPNRPNVALGDLSNSLPTVSLNQQLDLLPNSQPDPSPDQPPDPPPDPPLNTLSNTLPTPLPSSPPRQPAFLPCNPPFNPPFDPMYEIPGSAEHCPQLGSGGYNTLAGAYQKTQTADGFVYTHPTAGKSFGQTANRWDELSKLMEARYPGNPWGLWKNKQEWEIAKWMLTKKVLQGDLDELFATEMFKNSSLSFRSAKQLFDRIENEMTDFGGPKWHFDEVTLAEAPNEKHILVYRDVEKCGDYLLGMPDFSGQLAMKPTVLQAHDDETREFKEMCDGEEWNNIQNQPHIPDGTTIGGFIFASDKTTLSMHTGDVIAHGLYMTLANIPKNLRARNSQKAWMLIAYIPTSKWRATMREHEDLSDSARSDLAGVLNRILFHRCMSIVTHPLRREKPHTVVDANGIIRSVLYVLIAYIADLEEQLWITAIMSLSCPHCLTRGNKLGCKECQQMHTSEWIVSKIKTVLDILATLNGSPGIETPLQFLYESKKHSLCGVKKPFWVNIPHIDICKVLCLDLLHGFYKFFFDHVFDWNRTGLGHDELDARMSSQIQLSGDRVFPHGVSRISQMTGKEHCDLLRVHIPVVAGGPNGGSPKLTQAT